MDGTPAPLSSQGGVLVNAITNDLKIGEIDGCINTNDCNVTRQLRRGVLLDVAVHVCIDHVLSSKSSCLLLRYTSV